MNKKQLANKIWASANKMRSKIEASEYKDYILGFIFYKYLSDNEVAFLKKNGMSESEMKTALVEEDADSKLFIQENIGYFIAYDDLYSTWVQNGKDFDISDVTDALSAFGRLIHPTHKKVFDGIFNTLETGLSKLGDSAATRTKAIRDLLHLIKDIPMTTQQDYDVLGFIYEYLIGMFAANAGKKAGEFYTPHEVALLMSEIVATHLKDRREIQIFDSTSGSGSLLINIGRSVARHMQDTNCIKYYAQELKQNTYNLTRMNLVMRGIQPYNIVARNGDTLADDWPYFDDNDRENTYNPLFVDAVVSNPPYSQHWESSGKATNPRFARFGVAPKSKADYAFLLHDLYHIKHDGIVTIVLPHGVLFRGGEEGAIRRNLIEFNHIDTIIGLPANIFFGTGIPTIIMVLKKTRPDTDVFIIDASKGFEKSGKSNRLRACDIRRITDAMANRRSIPKYAQLVTLGAVRENDYNLNIPRYVDSSPEGETWDIYASMFGGIPEAEIDALQAYWKVLPGLRDDLFRPIVPRYYVAQSDNMRETILQHADAVRFTQLYRAAFATWRAHLRDRLLTNMMEVTLGKEETALSDDLFLRLQPVPLLDPYDAYQLFSDAWSPITVDLEILQTEGFNAVRVVEPHMVVKKSSDEDEEIQEGWQGRVLPFELVQNAYLQPQLQAIREKEERLAAMAADYEEILASINEDDKESAEELNEERDGFIPAAVNKLAKELRSKVKQDVLLTFDPYETAILQAADLMAKERVLRSQLKKEQKELVQLTMAIIEGLTDAQAMDLLEQKWISPLIADMDRLPEITLRVLATRVESLAAKYATTFANLEQELRSTEADLAQMVDQLAGNEYDRKGLLELKFLLMGEPHE